MEQQRTRAPRAPPATHRRRARRRPHQLEAVHQRAAATRNSDARARGRRRRCEHGRAQRRIFSETIASRRGAAPCSNATAPPTDSVRSSAESMREPEVELAAGVRRRRAARMRASRLVDEPAGEQRRAHQVSVEARRAGAAEAQRRQVPLDVDFDEVAAADLVQLGAGKRVVLAVALLVPVVDVVVAEAAEVEVRERLVAVAAARTRRRCATRSTSGRSAAATPRS